VGQLPVAVDCLGLDIKFKNHLSRIMLSEPAMTSTRYLEALEKSLQKP